MEPAWRDWRYRWLAGPRRGGFGVLTISISWASWETLSPACGERADSLEYGVDAHASSLQIGRVLEASRTPGRRWGSCRLVGRRWSPEATIS